jgi:acyl dehydratase
MADDGLVRAKLSPESIELMRRRIGYPNPSLRGGIIADKPWNSEAGVDTIRHWAIGIGDDNPLFTDPEYGKTTRWGGMIAPPGYDTTMGFDRSKRMTPEFEKETSKALRGVQLFNSGNEAFYHGPIHLGMVLDRSEWVATVEEKTSKFGGKSCIVTNGFSKWDQKTQEVLVTGTRWFVHVEREARDKKETRVEGGGQKIKAAIEPYSDAQIEEIEQAYENEYRRGRDMLYLEDVKVGDKLPKMVKGPFTITDHINYYVGWGWGPYGNPPWRLAYLNRKRLRGFYTRNEFNAWDTLQRVHWDLALAHKVGVQSTYDIGPQRNAMVCHYLSNYAGDDAWVYRIRCEYRNFNFVGDTTWIQAEVTAADVDPRLGPRIELNIKGTNQRGQENIRASATILCASRAHGAMKLPPKPPLPEHRS